MCAALESALAEPAALRAEVDRLTSELAAAQAVSDSRAGAVEEAARVEAETAAARHTADLQAARDQVNGGGALAVLSVNVSAEGPCGVCMFANACATMFVSAFWSRMSSRAVERAHLTSYCLCGVLGMLCPPPPLRAYGR